jgi:putative endonuclease
MKHLDKTRYVTGINAERLCRVILRLKFYRILAIRYRTPMGEIDIVAMRGNTVIAVEVKARPSHSEAAESLSSSQRHRIAEALQYFIMRHRALSKCDLRFDVMLVTPRRWPLHMQNAWHAD